MQPGRAIANARGVPGTLGCTARSGDELVLLTSHHVLFAGGAVRGDTVWLVTGDAAEPSFEPLGRARVGKLGAVVFGGREWFVDGAVVTPRPGLALPEPPRPATAALGSRVWKVGAATGETEGLVVAVDCDDAAWIDGRRRHAPRQILIGSGVDGSPFSAEGDSGAAVRDEQGRVIGLLWGANHRGQSVACPIAPILDVLRLELGRAA